MWRKALNLLDGEKEKLAGDMGLTQIRIVAGLDLNLGYGVCDQGAS